MRAFFLDAGHGGGQRFCLHHPARGPVKHGQILYLHPFAEEMNKARRMAALQARALAAAGYEVLQLDLLGCGDSTGDFGDASWDAWIDDVLLGCAWLRSKADGAPLWLWGLRAGCLLASAALRRLDVPAHLLLQQPPTSGKALVQQFLRLKVANAMMDGSGKGLMAGLRERLAQGEAVEIAGYRLASALAEGLERATLEPVNSQPDSGLRLMLWLELASRPDADWPPVARQAQQRWREAGWQVDAALVQGPAFWQTSEIEEAPALVEACVLGMKATGSADVVGAQA